MSYYQRPLANGQKFRCTVCGRIQYVKYVPPRYNPTKYICRRCAAQKRRKVPNELIALTNKVVITEAVQKRLKKKANADIPQGIEAIESKLQLGVFVVFLIAVFTITPILFDGFTSGMWLFAIGIGLFLPSFINFILLDHFFAKPKMDRNIKVKIRLNELAEERKKEIELRKQIYAAPEWGKLTKQVVKENGRYCAQCKKFIKDDVDLTIDHIRPISKYPDLAYIRDNLQVLCRQCNSAKGNREI